MLNAMAWALACFGVVAADIALSVVLFSVLDAVSVLTGYPIDNLDIQWFQAAAQPASFLMALLWWRYLWPRSFMARWQGVRPRMIGIGFALLLLTAGLTDNGTLPLWGTVLAGVVGLALGLGGVRDAA